LKLKKLEKGSRKGDEMKKLSMLVVFAATLILSAGLATAEVYETGHIISVTKTQPAPLCCYSGSDVPLHATAWDYKLRVQLGAKDYDAEYITGLDYFPSNLVSGADVPVRVAQHHLYLLTPGGELETDRSGLTKQRGGAGSLEKQFKTEKGITTVSKESETHQQQHCDTTCGR
jgi:hypothetical protein